MSLSSWIGSVGVTVLLFAFVLNLLKKLSADSSPYLLMNIVGALLAGISSFMIDFWPFVILESVWVIASLVPLLKKAT
ncbi:MAG: hypothetical protein SGJ15_06060 [Bacteroidota bacterium]|nr:hypothetical protein [Bacteroidota bacterium]